MDFYYYDGGERKGPIGTTQLKTLAALGKILRETELELEDGRRIQARQVKGLTFKGETPTESDASGDIYGVAVPPPSPVPPFPPVGGDAPNAGYPFPPAGGDAPNAGYPFPPAGGDAPNAGYPFPPAGGDAPNAGYPFPPAGGAAPNAGYPFPPKNVGPKRSIQGMVDKLAPRAATIVLVLAAVCLALSLIASSLGLFAFLTADEDFRDGVKVFFANFSCLAGAVYFSAAALLFALSFCIQKPRD